MKKLKSNLKTAKKKQKSRNQYINETLNELGKVGRVHSVPTNYPKKHSSSPLQNFILRIEPPKDIQDEIGVKPKILASIFRKHGWRARLLNESYNQDIYLDKNLGDKKANVVIVNYDIDMEEGELALNGKINHFLS